MPRRARKWLMLLAAAVLIGWPLYQLWGVFHATEGRQDARRLLYQVSLFQVELTDNLLHQAASAQSSSQLDALKQAVYAAGYAHDRLVLAYGGSRLQTLNSIPELTQYIVRLQIGGNRPLASGETDTLQDAAALFGELHAAYGELLSSGGGIVGSRERKVAQTDAELYKLLQSRLLQ